MREIEAESEKDEAKTRDEKHRGIVPLSCSTKEAMKEIFRAREAYNTE